MARKKSAEDLEWDKIFSTIVFEMEPPAKYIKNAIVQTKYGKKIKLNGKEFENAMMHERFVDPEDAIIESCKVNIDFELLKDDINKFALNVLKKSERRYKKSKTQLSQTKAIKPKPVPPPVIKS